MDAIASDENNKKLWCLLNSCIDPRCRDSEGINLPHWCPTTALFCENNNIKFIESFSCSSGHTIVVSEGKEYNICGNFMVMYTQRWALIPFSTNLHHFHA